MPGTHRGPINISRESVKGRKCEKVRAARAGACNRFALVVARSLTVHVTVPWPTIVFHLTLPRTHDSPGDKPLFLTRGTTLFLPGSRELPSTRRAVGKLLRQTTRDESRAARDTSRVWSRWQSGLARWCTNGTAGTSFYFIRPSFVTVRRNMYHRAWILQVISSNLNFFLTKDNVKARHANI